MTGKLNIFQKTMLQWNSMHAYNAVHVVRVPQALDLERLGHVIDTELEQLGLTGLWIDERRGAFEYRGGPVRNELKGVAAAPDVHAAIEREMETQLNRPFPGHGAVNPFRFFVIEEEGSFCLGIVYLHVVAGAESIILLLKHFVHKYVGKKEPVFSKPLNVYPEGYGKLIPWGGSLIFHKLSRLPSMAANLRRSSKPRYRDFQDQRNGVSVFSLSSGDLQSLFRMGKAWGVTLNDLFLALLLKALSPLAHKRFSAVRRRQMAVGSIVNIRKDLAVDSLKTFGLFLGSFIVTHPVPEGISTETLAREIQRQTVEIKKGRLYLGTPIELWLGRLLVSLSTPDHRSKFYPKNYPLWGGITNMNLNPLWEQGDEERACDYFRAVSTGPITPLVLSVTTVKHVANLGLTFKKTVFSQSEMDGFIANFKKSIKLAEVST